MLSQSLENGKMVWKHLSTISPVLPKGINFSDKCNSLLLYVASSFPSDREEIQETRLEDLDV